VYLDGKKSDLLADACIVERTHDADPVLKNVLQPHAL